MVMPTSRVLLVVDLLPVLERCAAARPCPQIHTHRLVSDGDVCLFVILITPVELVDNCQTPLSAAFVAVDNDVDWMCVPVGWLWI
jgi:hypothetical protein